MTRLATASPAELLLLVAFVVAFTHFLYGGARTLKWSDGDELAAGVAQLAFLAGAIATFYLAFLTPIALWNGIAGFTLLAGSVALYEWARRTVTDRGFHIAWTGDVPDALCAEGPYARIRHPLYLSYMLAFLALLAAMPTLAALALFVLGAALFTHAAISDERSLAASPLGEAYAEYKRSTGMFLPRLARPARSIRP
jgi:protein-S-isoprenylcysteine O-methyltransferase Ste14